MLNHQHWGTMCGVARLYTRENGHPTISWLSIWYDKGYIESCRMVVACYDQVSLLQRSVIIVK